MVEHLHVDVLVPELVHAWQNVRAPTRCSAWLTIPFAPVQRT
jgi:hypothetical protein